MPDAVFQALMSALPFATSLHSLAFSAERRTGSFNQTDLPWLAYALFHPRANASSWRHLALDKLVLTAQTSHVLTAMARGNNLVALLNGTAPTSDGYFSAELQSGTIVRLEPSVTSEKIVEIQAFGSRLLFLDVRSYTNVAASTLAQILRSCPSLKSLAVSHNGDFWSRHSSDVASYTARLQELELLVHHDHMGVALPTLEHVAGALCNLRSLRVRVPESTIDRLGASRATLVRLLEDVLSLQYVHWAIIGEESTRIERLIPYALSCEASLTALHTLRLADGASFPAQRSTTPSCAAAFLSVVARESNLGVHSALGQLTDRGVLSAIFEFSTSPVRRVIETRKM